MKIETKTIRYSKSRTLFAAGTFAFVFALVAVLSSCTKHLASTSTPDKKTSSAAAPATPGGLTTESLADSLIGSWRIKRTEIPQESEKMMTYGSQAEKDAITEKLKEIQGQFVGLQTTFKKDNTFQSTFSGQSDVGTWTIDDKMQIETTSKTTGNKSKFELQSLKGGVLTLKMSATDMVILLIFTKQ